MKTPIYDKNWARDYDSLAVTAIVGREGIYRLCASSLADVGESAHILIVGVGIGTELLELRALYGSRTSGDVESGTQSCRE